MHLYNATNYASLKLPPQQQQTAMTLNNDRKCNGNPAVYPPTTSTTHPSAIPCITVKWQASWQSTVRQRKTENRKQPTGPDTATSAPSASPSESPFPFPALSSPGQDWLARGRGVRADVGVSACAARRRRGRCH